VLSQTQPPNIRIELGFNFVPMLESLSRCWTPTEVFCHHESDQAVKEAKAGIFLMILRDENIEGSKGMLPF